MGSSSSLSESLLPESSSPPIPSLLLFGTSLFGLKSLVEESVKTEVDGLVIEEDLEGFLTPVAKEVADTKTDTNLEDEGVGVEEG